MVPTELLKPEVQPKKRHSIDDVEAPPDERVSTGLSHFDDVLGCHWNKPEHPGLHVPSLVLFAGTPGCGKSSILLRAAVKADTQSLYLTTEQTLTEIRGMVDRFQFTKTERQRLHAEEVHTLEEVQTLIKRYRARFVIIDSLTELTNPEKDNGDFQASITRTALALKKDTDQYGRAIVAVCQVNKQLDIVGLKRLEHGCGALMKLESFGPELRMLHCPEKNRFGRIGVKRWFRMQEGGLAQIGDPDPEELEELEET